MCKVNYFQIGGDILKPGKISFLFLNWLCFAKQIMSTSNTKQKLTSVNELNLWKIVIEEIAVRLA